MPTVTLALAGDTMLGRNVAEAFTSRSGSSLVARDLAELILGADVALLNLECCISDRGSRWPDPSKPFFFRAPPDATQLLVELGVDCVTLANNHALDYGADALLDTLAHLDNAGIAWVGAGPDVASARAVRVLPAGGLRLAVLGVTDHPADYAAAGPAQPGVAFADLWHDPAPDWLLAAVRGADADVVVVTPHWGPNMTTEPPPHVRAAASALVEAGATLVAGHSAHVFHGVGGRVLYDLGDFLDDYAVDPVRRNDLGLLFLVSLTEAGPVQLEAVPIRLEYCHTRLARGNEVTWIERRFRDACERLGTDVESRAGRLVVTW